MTSLAARAQVENPLEVYYDVLDALYDSPADASLSHVLAGLQMGTKAPLCGLDLGDWSPLLLALPQCCCVSAKAETRCFHNH